MITGFCVATSHLSYDPFSYKGRRRAAFMAAKFNPCFLIIEIDSDNVYTTSILPFSGLYFIKANQFVVSNRNGVCRFSLLTLIRLKGQIFLSPDRSKLCFELLEMNSAAQNHLPLEGQ